MRKLVAAQEDGELKAVCVQVAEVVHTCGGSHQGQDESKQYVYSLRLPVYSLRLHDDGKQLDYKAWSLALNQYNFVPQSYMSAFILISVLDNMVKKM